MDRIKKTFLVLVFLMSFLLVGCNQSVEFTIYFDSNGGSNVPSIKTDGKTSITMPVDPEKEGYEFVGWYQDDTFNISFTATSLLESPISSDITVYAKWELIDEEIVDIVYNILKEDIIVDSNGYQLDGELSLPEKEGQSPVVIIIGGSGPINMDGSIGKQTPYKDLAYGLAKKGIASIRCNKVTLQYTADVAAEYDFTMEDEYYYMIESMIQIAKDNNSINNNKIYLLGHSLGSQVIPHFLEKDSSLAGGIIMAGTTMHLLDLLLEQVYKQDENLYATYLPYCEDLKSLSEVREGEETYIYFGAYQAYYVFYNSINLELVEELDCSLLIMYGNLDLQIGINHFNEYQDLLEDKENVVFKEYELLNHLFTNGVGETTANAYQKYAKVDQQVIDDIADFIN